MTREQDSGRREEQGEYKEEDRERMVKGENSTQRNAEDQMRS